MKTERTFIDADRYLFDFRKCTAKNGFAQIDTSQDAWYFGTWANPTTLEIVSYCEGDVTHLKADNATEFVENIRQMKQWNDDNGHEFLGIDAMCREELIEAFQKIGLSDLLH